MESAHLTQAHDHVRTAATATLSNSIATAGHEHHLAAAAFHDAAQDTHNTEALRILDLLHHHHRKLAGLIKEAPRNKDHHPTKPQHPAHASTLLHKTAAAKPGALPASSSSSSSSSSPSSSAPRRRLPQSSIATNLAEKRGIPSATRTASGNLLTLLPAASALRHDQPTPVRDLLDRQPKPVTPPRHHADPAPPPASSAEDNFRRFYSAFGGVISAISAPLAFTSLPLHISPPTPVPEPPKDERPSKTKSRNHSPEASRTVKSSVPDLAALISKPALRALRDGSSQINPFASNESFYLVPTSGGTLTYASILQNPHAPSLHPIDEATDSLKGSSHEEFVDARESINPPSPTTSRRPHSRGNASNNSSTATATTTTTTTTTAGVTSQRSIPAGRGSGLKTLEELSLENETLKALVDKQAKRIQMWETNSQNQFNALAQSFRTKTNPPLSSIATGGYNTAGSGIPLHSPPLPHPNSNSNSTPASPSATAATAAAKKLAALESLLASQSAQLTATLSSNELLAKQNEKNAQVIARYREQWEKLKAGARKKELERRGKPKLGVEVVGGGGGSKMEGGASTRDSVATETDSGGDVVAEPEAELEVEAESEAEAKGGHVENEPL